jgi:hypothetical protein
MEPWQQLLTALATLLLAVASYIRAKPSASQSQEPEPQRAAPARNTEGKHDCVKQDELREIFDILRNLGKEDSRHSEAIRSLEQHSTEVFQLLRELAKEFHTLKGELQAELKKTPR